MSKMELMMSTCTLLEATSAETLFVGSSWVMSGLSRLRLAWELMQMPLLREIRRLPVLVAVTFVRLHLQSALAPATGTTIGMAFTVVIALVGARGAAR